VVQRSFPERAADRNLAFFPNQQGQVVSKRAMTETIRMAAQLLGQPLVSRDGAERVSGHSLRPTGAQGLARLGVDTWAIELLGRWGSRAVQLYVRDSAVSSAAARARASMLGSNLSDLIRETRRETGGADPTLMTDAMLRDAILRFAPAALTQWRASLLDEVRAELTRHHAAAQPTLEAAAAAEAPSSSSSSSSGSSDRDTSDDDAPPELPPERHEFEREVSSRWKAKRHLVAVGPPLADHTRWLTRCGWRFGVHGYAVRPDPAHPLCAKCARAGGG